MYRHKKHSGRRGSALVSALVAFTAVLVAGLGLLRLELALFGYPLVTCAVCVLAAGLMAWLSCQHP